jgi:hypothetical protein
MMDKKNINEEIERIKSLFTEERLYGNLVNEQEDDKPTDDDPFSKDAIKKRRSDVKAGNVKEKGNLKKEKKDELKDCNTSLKNYHRSFFAIDPEKRSDVIKIVTDDKYKTGLESCIKNYKDKLKPGIFAGMTKDEILDMLLIMLDPKADEKERLKYKDVTVKDSLTGTKPTTNIKTKNTVNIIDSNGNRWGTVQIIKNKEDEFIIKTTRKVGMVAIDKGFRGSIIKGGLFIPGVIESIYKINPSLKPANYKNIDILNTMGKYGQTIKIKVV